jgi:hypothetical protein
LVDRFVADALSVFLLFHSPSNLLGAPTLAQALFDLLLELLASESLLAITSATTTVGLHLGMDRIPIAGAGKLLVTPYLAADRRARSAKQSPDLRQTAPLLSLLLDDYALFVAQVLVSLSFLCFCHSASLSPL